MKIDDGALKLASLALYKDLGPLDDLPPELRNTLANVYYRYFDFSLNMGDPSKISGNENSDALSAYKGFVEDSANVRVEFENAPGMIKSIRETREQDQKIFDYLVTLTLDLFKYQISNVQQKTPIRRAVERKFKKPNEINGLYDKMEELRNDDMPQRMQNLSS